jgi:YHS domain-containing protein
MKTFMLTTIALAAFAGAALAAPAHSAKTPARAALVCPITGEKILSANAAAAHETYKGKTYYFCCPNCKPTFDKNPSKAVADAAHGKYDTM